MTKNFPFEEDKTVIIPARWTGGKWLPFDGGGMPKLKDGEFAELPLSQ